MRMNLKVHVTDVETSEYQIDELLSAEDGVVGALPVEVVGEYLEALDAYREARAALSKALEAAGLSTGGSTVA